MLTDWQPDLLRAALSQESRAFYIFTNSRSLSETAAPEINRQIAHNLSAAASSLGCEFDVISRSDSTLRGHFAAEIDALNTTLSASLGCTFDGLVLCPFFYEGRRLTAHDVHWVASDQCLIPAAQTEYARDATFGYAASNLCAWVESKSHGRIRAPQVHAISLDVIRQGGPAAIRRALGEVREGRLGPENRFPHMPYVVFSCNVGDDRSLLEVLQTLSPSP